MAMAIGILGGVVSMIGSIAGAQGTIAAGEAQQVAYDYQAAQHEAKAKEEVAAAQRKSFEKKKEGELVQSRIQAGAAASGFGAGALDPTIVDLSSDVAVQQYMNQGMEMYGGYSRANAEKAQANADRLSGDIAVMGAKTAAQGQIIGGISGMISSIGSFAGKYGAPTPDFSMASPLTARPQGYGFQYG